MRREGQTNAMNSTKSHGQAVQRWGVESRVKNNET